MLVLQDKGQEALVIGVVQGWARRERAKLRQLKGDQPWFCFFLGMRTGEKQHALVVHAPSRRGPALAGKQQRTARAGARIGTAAQFSVFLVVSRA